MAGDWRWLTDPSAYGTLFGETAAALAVRLDAPRVLLTGELVDDERLGEHLRNTGWQVEMPRRTRGLLGGTSHGPLRLWSVAEPDDVAQRARELWDETRDSICAYPWTATSAPTSWSAVCAAVATPAQPHLISRDADAVRFVAGDAADADGLRRAVLDAARQAARARGGDIRDSG